MDHAQEVSRIRMVRKAIESLLSGREMTRPEAFNGAPDSTKNLQKRVLDRLVDRNMLSKYPPTTNGEAIRYQVRDERALRELIGEDEYISDIIWMRNATPQVPPEEPFNAPAPVPPQDTQPADMEAKVDEILNDEKALMTLLVRLNKNGLESLIYLRDRVDDLHNKVESLSAKLDAVMKLWG